MKSDDDAREVQERMARLRREIAVDAEQVAQQARAMTDWTFYVRKFPWAAVGLAAAAGFLLVPKKQQVVQPTPEQLAALAKNREFVNAATTGLKPPPNMLGGIAATLATMAGRAALSYFTEQIRNGAFSKPVNPGDATAKPSQEPKRTK